MAHKASRSSGAHDEETESRLRIDLEAAAPRQDGASASGSSYAHYDNHKPSSPLGRRMTTRAATFKTIEEFEEFNPDQPGWRPGAEPGFDPAKSDGGHDSMPSLQSVCEITVADYSESQMNVHHLDNEGLIEFLKEPRPSWAKCRWINVNGLSWDVIQALGRYKTLHSLALEDVFSSALNTKNRTKVDWYVLPRLTLEEHRDEF
jgi:hypothetical protein